MVATAGPPHRPPTKNPLPRAEGVRVLFMPVEVTRQTTPSLGRLGDEGSDLDRTVRAVARRLAPTWRWGVSTGQSSSNGPGRHLALAMMLSLSAADAASNFFWHPAQQKATVLPLWVEVISGLAALPL